MEDLTKILDISIENEMQNSYINYAMSVIVSRALPDVRDGLKPVHRRILYSMNELHLDPSKGYKKSARIVGDTMGKYHPHGDSSIYDAMVRMAQPFSMRYMLVDGHGNFGSIDGDSAAAQRYTEAKLQHLSVKMLEDIEKNTVDFMKNYDEEFEEPTVLPARFPNLLVNGSSGIAVGMATNMPPHNLKESISAICKIIDNKVEENRDTDIDEVMELVKAPDFPTGATILGTKGVKQAYRTGRGKVIVRAKADIETLANGKSVIYVTEIPYQVNKAKLMEKIADLVKDKKVEGITDLRDESDRNGIKIVIELKRDVNANVILNQLYKYSQLQETFGINNLALVNNEPKVLNLLELLTHYLDHQKEVVTRKTQYDLEKAEKRAHIIQGFFIALDNIDEVIKIIRASTDVKQARENLIERFDLSEAQAIAIVEMRLRSLTGLERDKLQKEFDELMALIEWFRKILGDENVLYGVIRDDLVEISSKFGDERRTEILPFVGDFEDEDLIEDELSVITLTHMDYIKRLPLSTYKSQNRGGKGIMGMQTREEDTVKDLIVCSTHDHLLFFTNKGKVYRKKGYEIPEAGRNAKGNAIVNILNLDPDEKIKSVIPIRELSKENEQSFVMITKRGTIKKTYINQFTNIRQQGLIAVNIVDGDELVNVDIVEENETIFVATNKGLCARFESSAVRNMGRSATGVRAIRTTEDNYVVGFVTCTDEERIIFVSDKGYGKATNVSEFGIKNRGIKGVTGYKIVEKTGQVSNILTCHQDEEIMMLNSNGVIIRIKASDIPTIGRVTSGVKLINIGEDDYVTSVSKITREQLDTESDDEIIDETENNEDNHNAENIQQDTQEVSNDNE